jgi:uncharacterized membrane protein
MVRVVLSKEVVFAEKTVRYPMEQSASSFFKDTLGRSSATDLERWLTLAASAAVMAYGVSRRSAAGTCLAVAAVPLAYRGATGEWPRLPNISGTAEDDTRTALSGERGTHVRETVRVEKPVAEVFRFWRQLENFPCFMSYLDEVTDLGNGRSHWVAKGPADIKVEWDAEIINEVENKVIGWRSLPGADVVTAGSVNFKPAFDGRGTEVSVHLQYEPPAGKAGTLIASFFGVEPSQTIHEDLHRVKDMLEAGETSNV